MKLLGRATALTATLNTLPRLRSFPSPAGIRPPNFEENISEQVTSLPWPLTELPGLLTVLGSAQVRGGAGVWAGACRGVNRCSRPPRGAHVQVNSRQPHRGLPI